MSTSKEIANIDKQLQEEANAIADTISAPSTNKIKTNDKVFTLPDGQVLAPPLTVVIVDYLSRNLYYDKPYREGDPQDPVCWAINKKPADLAPGADVPEPMHETCNGCEYDEFGTSATGQGKACKNTRVMAVVLPTLKDEKLYTLEASPTAIQAFDAYVGTVAKVFGSIPIKVTTEISFHPEKTYPSLMFGNPQPNPKYAEHFARRQEALDLLNIAPVSGVTVPAPARKTATRKKAVRRRR